MASIRRREPHRIETADSWNARVPIGTAVRYFPVRGLFEHIETRTRSVAWELGHGDVVVSVDGKAGGVLLDHLVLIEDGEELERILAMADKLLADNARHTRSSKRGNAALAKLATIVTSNPLNWDEHPRLREQLDALLAEIAAIDNDDEPAGDPREHKVINDKEQDDGTA